MSAVPKSYELTEQDRADPVVWIVETPLVGNPSPVDASDQVVQSYFGSSSSRRLKVFESDSEGVHFLLMRGGTSMHTDKACPRYSHHLVLRNDGTGIRGLHGDKPEHLPMRRGVMYCLDTHSPHQGLRDSRLFPMEPLVKLVVAVDRDEPLDPGECLELVTRILDTNVGDWRPNR